MADEPEHILHLRLERFDAEKFGAGVARQAAAAIRNPEFMAGLSGEVLLPLIVFRGRKVPLVPFFVVALMGFAGGRMAYRSYRNLEILASAAKADA